MKKVILALTLIGSAAFANSSVVSYPKYDGVSVDNLCDAGTHFQTVNPVQVCDSWTQLPSGDGEQYHGSDYKCNSAHYEQMSVSKTGSTCVRYDYSEQNYGTCLEMGTTTRPNTVIAEKWSMNEGSDVQYFNYTIPACTK